jgi:hypothetical protein
MMDDDDEHLTGRTGQKGKPMALFAVVFKVMDEQHGVWVPNGDGLQTRAAKKGYDGRMGRFMVDWLSLQTGASN